MYREHEHRASPGPGVPATAYCGSTGQPPCPDDRYAPIDWSPRWWIGPGSPEVRMVTRSFYGKGMWRT